MIEITRTSSPPQARHDQFSDGLAPFMCRKYTYVLGRWRGLRQLDKKQKRVCSCGVFCLFIIVLIKNKNNQPQRNYAT